MEQCREFTYKDHNVIIYYDEDPIDPRIDHDNLGLMVCFHSRYNLGDKHGFVIEEFKELLGRDDVLCLPLYLYDHSGITMSTRPFSCPWDSGQVGGIFVTKEQIRAEWHVKRISQKLREQIFNLLRAEVEEYDNYITGNVYGYRITIEGDFKDEEVESCWGFFGDPEEYMIPEIKSIIDHRCQT